MTHISYFKSSLVGSTTVYEGKPNLKQYYNMQTTNLSLPWWSIHSASTHWDCCDSCPHILYSSGCFHIRDSGPDLSTLHPKVQVCLISVNTSVPSTVHVRTVLEYTWAVPEYGLLQVWKQLYQSVAVDCCDCVSQTSACSFCMLVDGKLTHCTHKCTRVWRGITNVKLTSRREAERGAVVL